LRPRPGPDRVIDPAQSADTKLKRLDHLTVLDAQRAGLADPLCLLDELLLLLGEPVQPLGQLGPPDVGLNEGGVQLRPDPLRLVGDLLDVGHVVRVGIALCLAATARDPEHQEDDDQDREADQADEAEERRQA